MAYKLSFTDGGRSNAGVRFALETNDCSVRALTAALDMPYANAHAHLESHGRRFGRGAELGTAINAYGTVKHEGRRVRQASLYTAFSKLRTLNAWLTSGALPKRCIIQTRGHVFAVVDGVVLDSARTGPRKRVHRIWEVISADHAD